MILFIGDVDRGTRNREAFQEVDFQAMFAPLAKWAARIDDAARIPEYIARAYATAMSGRPGPVVLALPEDMLCDLVEGTPRSRIARPSQDVRIEDAMAVQELIAKAERPVAIIGGAHWTADAVTLAQQWGEAAGIPLVAAFRRQDAVSATCPVYAGNLGYGPNPALVTRVKQADLLIVLGARLGEATTDGYGLISPDHPGQTLVHIHPDPEELHSTYRTDLALCCDVDQALGMLELLATQAATPHPSGAEAHADYLAWSNPTPRDGVTFDLGQCVAAMREALPADSILCNGAGNYSGWWHRYWHYEPGCQLAPTCGAMGYGVPAATAAALRHPDRMVVALAGDGCFLMNGQELATAVQHGAQMLVIVVDNGGYGTIRMHQEREYPGRVAATALAQSGLRGAGESLWMLERDGDSDRRLRPRPVPRDGAGGRAAAAPEDGYRGHHPRHDIVANRRTLDSFPRKGSRHIWACPVDRPPSEGRGRKARKT